MLDLFLDAERLMGVADDPALQIVAVDDASTFNHGHIPDAIQIDLSAIVAEDAPVSGLLPDDDTLAAALSRAGLRNDAHIVAYDSQGDTPAARLLYTLDAIGHHRISLLDGGLSAWQAAGGEVVRGPAQAEPTDFTVDRQQDRIADRQWIESKLDDPGVTFLDARSAPEYAGADVRSRRGGHIPGAVSLDWRLMRNDDGRLRSERELLTLMTSHDISDSREIVHYCQSHMRSSYTYLVLKSLGYENQRGYPGAWSEWGNADDTPIHVNVDNEG